MNHWMLTNGNVFLVLLLRDGEKQTRVMRWLTVPPDDQVGQAKKAVDCLAEAGKKVGAASELVPSERLGEVRRALEVYRDGVLGTVDG